MISAAISVTRVAGSTVPRFCNAVVSAVKGVRCLPLGLICVPRSTRRRSSGSATTPWFHADVLLVLNAVDDEVGETLVCCTARIVI